MKPIIILVPLILLITSVCCCSSSGKVASTDSKTQTPQDFSEQKSDRTPTAQPFQSNTQTVTITATEVTPATSTPTKELPTDTPQPPTATPELAREEGLLYGISQGEIKVILENINFECDLIGDDGEYMLSECVKEGVNYRAIVEINASNFEYVHNIQATIIQFVNANNDLAISFLGYIATMPFDGAEPDNAKAWVEQTLPTIEKAGDIRTATFGNVPFQLYGILSARTLTIGPDLPFP